MISTSYYHLSSCNSVCILLTTRKLPWQLVAIANLISSEKRKIYYLYWLKVIFWYSYCQFSKHEWLLLVVPPTMSGRRSVGTLCVGNAYPSLRCRCMYRRRFLTTLQLLSTWKRLGLSSHRGQAALSFHSCRLTLCGRVSCAALRAIFMVLAGRA